ncbi:MAG: GIY-YIG nuclease family protein [Lentisphaerae bacterium]|nr:GIY-YIG nuclease family protein [Lentisphaerota bacterium]
MRYHAYILKSTIDGSYYKGSCDDLTVRLARHNGGKVKSTKRKRPWTLHYFETFATRSEALKRERFFKSRSGYRWLRTKGLT